MRLTTLAAAGAIALTAAGASFAQTPPSPAAAPAAPGGHPWRHLDPAQRAERHAERLRAILQLRPDQEPALRALIAALRPSPDQLARRQAERAEAAKLTTPQRLDRMQARMTERQARFAQRAEAIKRFYAQLSPAQQKAFDALHQGGGMRGLGRHGGFGHGHGHGDGHGRPPALG